MLALEHDGQIIHFQDDSPACGFHSHLEVSVDALETYLIIVQGYGGTVGDFRLELTCTESTLQPTSQPTTMTDEYACMFGCEESQTTCDNSHRIAQPCTRRDSCSLSECLAFCSGNDDCRYAFRNDRGICYLYDDCTNTRRTVRLGYTKQRLGDDVDPDDFFSVTGTGCEVNGNCVQSRNYPGVHGNNEYCSVNVLNDAYLTVGSTFSVETGYDHLLIDGSVMESSSRIPDQIAAGTPFTWSTDYSVTRNGWQICFSDHSSDDARDVEFVDLYGSSDAPSRRTCHDEALLSTVCTQSMSCSLNQCSERCAADGDCQFFFSNNRGGCMFYGSCTRTRWASSEGRTLARVN